MTTIENEQVAVSFDAKARLAGFRNKVTGTELIGHEPAADAWRIVIPSGRHTIDFVSGAAQAAARVTSARAGDTQTLCFEYPDIRTPQPVIEEGVLVDDGGPELEAWVELDNHSDRPVDEVEFPVIGGLTGFATDDGRRRANLVVGSDRGRFYDDVLNGAMPNTGPEYFDFGREHETAMFEPDAWGHLWMDVWGPREGLYLFCRKSGTAECGMILERYPTQAPQDPREFAWRGDAHVYPPGTPRWLRWIGVHAPRVAPGGRWQSGRLSIVPHAGDWHAGADHYSALRHRDIAPATPPAWLNDFTGWTGIGLKTYVGQVFHTFAKTADAAIQDQANAGLDMVFAYGHTNLGCEGADFDWSPGEELGGEKGFREMTARLHRHGIRLMLLDHLHRYINQDVPQYRALNLERFAVINKAGQVVTAQWPKDTFLSYRHNAGPTPLWSEICPSCDEWLAIYLRHLARMIELGVDALELDCLTTVPCHNPAHPHPAGNVWEWKLRFLKTVRARARELNPDFAFFCEAYHGWEVAEHIDAFLPGDRYCNDHGRIYRYMFPELHLQTVKVSNYDYDSVNKALCLGIGVDTEIWGIRKSVSAACPELARYIGEINRFRLRHREILMRGTFRDTLGAAVQGTPNYGVLRSEGGEQALVLRNATPQAARVTAALESTGDCRLHLWRPWREEEPVPAQPITLDLEPFGVAVLLALRQEDMDNPQREEGV